MKQYSDRSHSSTKLTPIQACLKKNEGYVFLNILDKQKIIKPKFQVHNLIQVADLQKALLRGVSH